MEIQWNDVRNLLYSRQYSFQNCSQITFPFPNIFITVGFHPISLIKFNLTSVNNCLQTDINFLFSP